MADQLSAWKPELHPRDNKGKFRKKAELITEAERAVGRDVLSRFKPRSINDDAAATRYLHDAAPRLSDDDAGVVDRYTGDTFFDLNRRLRDGDDSDPEVARLDAAMRPLPDDLIVTRHLHPEAFGLTGKTLTGVEDLQGRKIVDHAYSSTALGSPYGGGFGGVTMHIAVPQGTPSVMASAYSRNPHEREILLDRDVEIAVTRVAKNSKHGYDVFAIVLPKKTATPVGSGAPREMSSGRAGVT